MELLPDQIRSWDDEDRIRRLRNAQLDLRILGARVASALLLVTAVCACALLVGGTWWLLTHRSALESIAVALLTGTATAAGATLARNVARAALPAPVAPTPPAPPPPKSARQLPCSPA